MRLRRIAAPRRNSPAGNLEAGDMVAGEYVHVLPGGEAGLPRNQRSL
jgi:hypothetical protein